MTNGHTRGPTITYCPAIKVAFRVGFYEGKNCPQSPIPIVRIPVRRVYSNP